MLFLSYPHRPLIMGIVNVTPDSFSGDGLGAQDDCIAAARAQGLRMLDEGADSLDIGGESSRPGATPVSAAEEMGRVLPVIAALRNVTGAKPIIAVDTVKASVADAALKAGANVINDITAMRHDPAMAETIARHQCPVILMHNRSRSQHIRHDERLGSEYGAADYGDIIEDVKRDLMESVTAARQAGISDTNIILDPGLGFGKSVAQNLALIKNIPRFKELGFPLLLGPSRKSFIGHVLDLPVEDRLEGTAATVAISAFLGADIVRVHDVKFMARVARMVVRIQEPGIRSQEAFPDS